MSTLPKGVSSALDSVSSDEHDLSPQWHVSFSESIPVEITVGDDHRRYYVHKDKLCSKSGYFRARTNFYEIDPQENTLKAHLATSNGHDSKAFSIIAQWFYDGPRALSMVATREGHGYNANRRAQLLLTRVYIEADRLIMPQLKNEIVDTIINFSSSTLPSLKSLKLIREALPLDTSLEKYFFECLAFWLCVCPEFLHFNVNGWHLEADEYLQQDRDMAYAMLKKVCCSGKEQDLIRDPHTFSKCRYHDHGAEAPIEDCSECSAAKADVLEDEF